MGLTNGFGKSFDLLRGWENGGRKELWVNHAVSVANFIKRENLARTQIAITANNSKIKLPLAKGKKGFPGIPVPHLHFKGEIYLVNEAQWGKFSKEIVSDFRGKLEGVNTVGLEALSGMSAIINKL
ncbi:MAG: hypothetical protein HYV24_01955 [Deltaproteobacteria bacterium]|nr:hypothetical protein [Deltaproteobacteria bacterium]